jgi:hypothetical protein
MVRKILLGALLASSLYAEDLLLDNSKPPANSPVYLEYIASLKGPQSGLKFVITTDCPEIATFDPEYQRISSIDDIAKAIVESRRPLRQSTYLQIVFPEERTEDGYCTLGVRAYVPPSNDQESLQHILNYIAHDFPELVPKAVSKK